MKDETAFIADMIEKINRLWNNGEISVAADIATPDCVRHVPGSPVVEGLQALGESILSLREQYPDLLITFEKHLFDGETMMIQWRTRGTDLGGNPEAGIEPTGEKVDYRGVDVLHIKDDKIVEDFAYFDQVTIMQQLGLMPEMDQ